MYDVKPRWNFRLDCEKDNLWALMTMSTHGGFPENKLLEPALTPFFAWFRRMPVALCVCVTLRQLTLELLGTNASFGE